MVCSSEYQVISARPELAGVILLSPIEPNQPARTPIPTLLLNKPVELEQRARESCNKTTKAEASQPRKFSLETESATPRARSSQTLARTGQERKTPGSRSLEAGR